MKFNLKAARLHPLHGLEVIDEYGDAYLCGEKITMAEEEGVVIFREIEDEDCPYSVRHQYDLKDNAGTDDPLVVALTLKWLRGELPSAKDWIDIPLND